MAAWQHGRQCGNMATWSHGFVKNDDLYLNKGTDNNRIYKPPHNAEKTHKMQNKNEKKETDWVNKSR